MASRLPSLRFLICLAAAASPLLPHLTNLRTASAQSALAMNEPDEKPTSSAADESPTSRASASRPAKDAKKPGGSTPQVEVFIPSVTRLVDAAQRSQTAQIVQGVAGLFAVPSSGTEDQVDLAAALEILQSISRWPDTSLALATYTQDREGRPRWAVRVDWPLEKLVDRVRALLELKGTKKLLKEVTLRKGNGPEWRIELPDIVLAVLRETKGGSLLASAEQVVVPEEIFGRKKQAGGAAAESSQLVYCRLNLDAGDEEGSSPGMFGMIVGVKNIRYGATLDERGQWKERFSVGWNPVIGMGIKSSLKKVGTPFFCPGKSLAAAAFSIEGGGMADGLAGLPDAPIGGREGNDMAVVVAIGDGFLPVPNLYYLFNSRSHESILKSIRKAIAEDTAKREVEDRPPAWRETRVDGEPVFWRDPAAEEARGIAPLTFRTVIFFDEVPREGQDPRKRLIIAATPAWADDAVRHWKALRRGTKQMLPGPSDTKPAWELVIRWREIYTLAEPYLMLMASLNPDARAPASAEQLAAALEDSRITVRIEYAGLDVRHAGPIPVGAAYIPAVVASSLSARSSADSEAERERVACQNLRVLHHHAKLFRKDYGRWPTSVAELDGYVDFKSHPYLLSLRDPDRGFAGRLAAMFSRSETAKVRREGGEEIIDDSLYVIDWSPTDWRLKLRKDCFKEYATIAIDAEGAIHRIPKDAATTRESKARNKAA